MSKKTKSRRKAHNYTFGNKTVNLNGYVAKCNVTGEEKRFYHSYLANMIESKFDNDFDLFESSYVSRSGKAVTSAATKSVKLEDRISALYVKIRELKAQRDELAATNS